MNDNIDYIIKNEALEFTQFN